MDELLKKLNTDDIDELERICVHAADLGLHHLVMMIGKRATDIISQQQNLLPRGQEFLRHMTVAAYYTNNAKDREIAREVSNRLALSRTVSRIARDQARANQIFYMPRLENIVTGLQRHQLTYDDIKWNVTNPSIVDYRDELWLIQRSVNYRILPDGRYDTGINDPIKTKNYLVKLNYDLKVELCMPIQDPDSWPQSVWPLVQGFEDCRLFVSDNQLWTTCTVRDQHPEGLCEIYMFRIDGIDTQSPKFVDGVHIAGPEPEKHQKNWMPLTPITSPAFVYQCDPVTVIGSNGQVISFKPHAINTDNFRGGGQVFVFDNGLLGIIHESIHRNDGLREYLHRFIKFDHKLNLIAVSDSFKISNSRIEFAAGLTQHPQTGDVIISYGEKDATSWLAQIPESQVRKLLIPIEHFG